MPTFLTADEVAQQLRIGGKQSANGKAVLARYRKNGLPYYQFGTYKAARILYAQEDVDKWVYSQRITG